MKCVVCKQGELRKGAATGTLERDRMILIYKKVPAEVCGEEYVSEETARAGVKADIREYVAA